MKKGIGRRHVKKKKRKEEDRGKPVFISTPQERLAAEGRATCDWFVSESVTCVDCIFGASYSFRSCYVPVNKKKEAVDALDALIKGTN